MSRMLVPKRRATTTVTVLVDDELRARLERAALANERSLGGEIRAALRRYLEEHPEHEKEEAHHAVPRP
jgi:predicted transcriptional regulator